MIMLLIGIDAHSTTKRNSTVRDSVLARAKRNTVASHMQHMGQMLATGVGGTRVRYGGGGRYGVDNPKGSEDDLVIEMMATSFGNDSISMINPMVLKSKAGQGGGTNSGNSNGGADAASSAGAEVLDEGFASEGDVEMVVNNPMAGYAADDANKTSGSSQCNFGLEAAAEEIEVVVAMEPSRPAGGGDGSTSMDASGLDGLFTGFEESMGSCEAGEEPTGTGSDSHAHGVGRNGRQSKRVSEFLQQPQRSAGRRSSVSGTDPAMGQQLTTSNGLKRAGTFRL
jgi:hypothetical protein